MQGYFFRNSTSETTIFTLPQRQRGFKSGEIRARIKMRRADGGISTGRADTHLSQDVNLVGDIVDKPLSDRHGGLELFASFSGN
jgi:hypothetical protein